MPEDFFEVPEDNPPIWRFIDHSKFIWILQNSSLYFRRTDLMNDPYEGHPPISYLEDRMEDSRSRRDRINEILPPDGGDAPLPSTKPSDVLEPFEHFRRCYYINCWHMSDHESVAMWKLYLSSGDGVAIKTNYKTVFSAIKNSGDLEIIGGRMNYEDFENEEFDYDNILPAQAMKQQEYSYENEIRYSLYSPPATENEDPDPGDPVNYQYSDQEEGIPVKINLEELIDEVRISPYSPSYVDTEYWEDILKKYSIDVDVSESLVTVPPKNRLES